MDTCNVADILARYSKPRIKEPQDFSCPKTLKVVSVTFHAPLDLTIHDSQGMYDSGAEHDACGVGMVTTLNKRPERKIVDDAIEVLVNLNHRGAVGAEENTGDGAGILMSMPDEFMRATAGVELLKKAITPRASPSWIATSPLPASRSRPFPRSCAKRASKCSHGASYPPIRTDSACRRWPACRRSRRWSWPIRKASSVASSSIVRPSAFASVWNMRWASTSRPCPHAPSPTRACSPPCSSSPSSWTCPTNA